MNKSLAIVTSLPCGVYRFANRPHDAALATLSWLLSGYRFQRYKTTAAICRDFVFRKASMPRGSSGLQRVSRLAAISSTRLESRPRVVLS
jgi:hypothetical protein